MKKALKDDNGMGQRLLARISTMESRLRGFEAEQKKLLEAMGALSWDLKAAKEMLHRLMRSEGG
jgi:CII-binding regulator of phage lambda lysogenization HflD